MGIAERQASSAGRTSGASAGTLRRVERPQRITDAGVTPSAPADPRPAIARAYRFERARRSLRLEHRDEHRRAQRRFWFTLAVLVGVVLVIGGITVHQLQQLFGI